MASGTISLGKSGSLQGQIVWSSSGNGSAANSSNVTADLQISKESSSTQPTLGTFSFYLSVAGKELNTTWYGSVGNSWVTIATLSTTISHSDDGKCSCYINAKVNGPTGTSLAGKSIENGEWVTLDFIARKSQPSCNNTATMKGPLTINTNRKSTSFTHTLQYKFGGTTQTIATGVGDSYAWTIPDLAHLCNNKLSDTCTITCTTYNGSVMIGEETCTTTIYVPSKTVPSFPNGDVILGSGNPITTNAGSANFTHIISYSFNGKTGNVNDEKVKSGIVWWTPYELASYIPSDTSGNGTITCETYNGTALVGKSDPVSFKAIVPDNSTTRPSFVTDGFVLSPSGSLLPNFDGLYIQGKTGVKAQFTASSTYSAIASYKLSVDGRVYTGNPATSNALTKDGNIEVIGTVTDARGYYTAVPTSISVIPYSIPSIGPCEGDKEIICERSDKYGVYNSAGTHLHIRAKRSYSPVMADGTQKNFCNLKYRYKASGGSWSDEKTILAGTDTSTDVYEGTIDDVVTETDKTYAVQLIVEDTIGEKIYYDFVIPTDTVTLHLGEGGHGVAVGKYSEATVDKKMFESQWDAKFYGELQANHIASLGLYDGEDFNDFVYQTGYYVGISAPSASGCNNYPVDKTGILEVISAMQQDWGYSYQTYRTHDGEVYMRSYHDSTGFSDWKKVSV